MLINLIVNIVISLHKDGNYFVSLLLVSGVVFNTIFSGVGNLAILTHLSGGQAIDPLFNYFTPSLINKIFWSIRTEIFSFLSFSTPNPCKKPSKNCFLQRA